MVRRFYGLFVEDYSSFIYELKYHLKSSKISEKDIIELIFLVVDEEDISFLIQNNFVNVGLLLNESDISSKIINCLLKETNNINSEHIDLLIETLLKNQLLFQGLNKNSILFLSQQNNDKLSKLIQ